MDGIFVSDYTLELTRACDYTDQYINYVSMLCDARSRDLKEKDENYRFDRIHHCFVTGKFAYGFCIIKCKGIIVCTVGLNLFKGWVIASRYLRHNDHNRNLLPIRWLVHEIVDNYLDNTVVGFCTTQNTNQRSFIGISDRRNVRNQRNAIKYGPDSVYAKTIQVNNNTKKLDYLVWYRNTVQEVYTYYTDKIPPFEPYLSSL